MRTPIAASFCSVSSGRLSAPTSALSVSSSWSSSGGRPVPAMIRATSDTKPGSVACWADRLTLMNGACPGRVRCHCAAWAQAVSMTQRPSGVMTPLASAASMNDSGDSSPSVGWCQRSRASAPRRSPSGRPTMGW